MSCSILRDQPERNYGEISAVFNQCVRKGRPNNRHETQFEYENMTLL